MKFINEKNAHIIVFVGLVIAFTAPWAITRPWLSIASYRDTGQIGDTIGGIAGPILNFIGILLVYFSFKQQYEANQIQTKVNEQLREDFNIQLSRADKERHFELIQKLLEQLKQASYIKINFGEIESRLEELFRDGDFDQDMRNIPYHVTSKAPKQKLLADTDIHHLLRLRSLFIMQENSRNLYYFLHKSEQIISRLETLTFFLEQEAYLKEEFILTLHNQIGIEFYTFEMFLNNSKETSGQLYYDRVLTKSDFYQNLKKVLNYYRINQGISNTD